MKLKLTILLCLFAYLATHSQNFNTESSIYITGKVKNFKEKYFEFFKTGYINESRNAVVYEKDGSFTNSFNIEGKQQDIYLFLNNSALTFTVHEKDSIEIFWDENDFKNTFKISAKDPLRSKMLNIQWQKYLTQKAGYFNLLEKLYKQRASLTDSEKFELINKNFNSEIAFLIEIAKEFPKVLYSNLYADIFYEYAEVLQRFDLLSKYELNSVYSTEDSNLTKLLPTLSHRILDSSIFWQSVDYRDFLYNYLRYLNVFKSYSGNIISNPTLDDYYLAKSVLKIPAIQNWFITKTIIDDFRRYDFNKVESVYNLFKKELKDNTLKEILQNKYISASTLKPGKPAPAFTLKDMNGKNVSLADFKGKVVYIDFWGVSCEPCISDIELNSHHFHGKYQGKNIVFVSICVDANEQQWKNALLKYKMNGSVNLIAKGWESNPVCKAYNIIGIPHYFLIDKDGKIVDNNAPSMGRFLWEGENDIDKLLK